MISKISASVGALVMISSVNGFLYDRNSVDIVTETSGSYQVLPAGCAQCIRAGFVWQYEVATSATINTATTPTASYVTSKTIGGITEDTNKCTMTGSSTVLDSNDFKSPYAAIANCPMKTSVCGSSASTTLADKAAAAVDFSVTAMTQDDQCSYTIKATCDLPVVTIKAATGSFLGTAKKVNVDYIEGTDQTMTTTTMPMDSDSTYLGKQGSMYPIFLEGIDPKFGQSPIEKAMDQSM